MAAPGADAQLAVSANDNKVVLVNGAATVVPAPASDTLTVIDLKSAPPRVIAEVPVPGSTILVGNMVEKDVQVLNWDGKALRETGRIKVGGGSAALRIADK